MYQQKPSNVLDYNTHKGSIQSTLMNGYQYIIRWLNILLIAYKISFQRDLIFEMKKWRIDNGDTVKLFRISLSN